MPPLIGAQKQLGQQVGHAILEGGKGAIGLAGENAAPAGHDAAPVRRSRSSFRLSRLT